MAYANPDYDPVKAHEYYEKHKKLKGRKRSTKGFSQTQKEQWAYAQDQLKEQKKGKDSDIAAQRKAQLSEASSRISQQKKEMTKQAQEKIKQIKELYKNASPDLKARVKSSVEGMIASIKEKTQAQKDDLSARGKAEKNWIREKATNAKADNKQAYEKALDDAYERIKKG